MKAIRMNSNDKHRLHFMLFTIKYLMTYILIYKDLYPHAENKGLHLERIEFENNLNFQSLLQHNYRTLVWWSEARVYGNDGVFSQDNMDIIVAWRNRIHCCLNTHRISSDMYRTAYIERRLYDCWKKSNEKWLSSLKNGCKNLPRWKTTHRNPFAYATRNREQTLTTRKT